MYYRSFTAVKDVAYSKFAEVFGNKNEVKVQYIQTPFCGISVGLSRSSFNREKHLISSLLLDLRCEATQAK